MVRSATLRAQREPFPPRVVILFRTEINTPNPELSMKPVLLKSITKQDSPRSISPVSAAATYGKCP